ncbi:hypothetical protein ACH5RR_020092, partial [Cinchona calisaya]
PQELIFRLRHHYMKALPCPTSTVDLGVRNKTKGWKLTFLPWTLGMHWCLNKFCAAIHCQCTVSHITLITAPMRYLNVLTFLPSQRYVARGVASFSAVVLLAGNVDMVRTSTSTSWHQSQSNLASLNCHRRVGEALAYSTKSLPIPVGIT